MDNFIVEFKQAFSAEFCQELINRFNASGARVAGRTGSGVDKTKKDSLDLYISELADWQPHCQHIQQVLMQALVQYCRRYPHFLTASVTPSIKDEGSGKITAVQPELLHQFSDQQLANLLAGIFEPDHINMQFYQQGEGGFHHWHAEHYPHPTDKSQKSLRRVLLWLIYLNDVESGGETEFYFQQASLKPTQGSLVLSPCGFTHTHRGKVPESGDKYVLASWIMYRDASVLYPSA